MDGAAGMGWHVAGAFQQLKATAKPGPKRCGMRIASLQVGCHSSARQYFVPPAGTNIPGKDSVFVEHLEERNMAELDHLMLYQVAFYCHPPNDCVFCNTALSYSVTVVSGCPVYDGRLAGDISAASGRLACRYPAYDPTAGKFQLTAPTGFS
jgi:hypothetical protein